MTKNKVIVIPGDSGALTHNPFAKLAALPVAVTAALKSAPVATVSRPQPVRPAPPCKVRVRLETRGRSGKAVTRIEGLPAENLEAIASRLRKALGCGATVEGADLLLIGSLVERANQWLDKVDDLRSITEEKPKTVHVVAAESLTQPISLGSPSRLSPMRRSDIHRGQRVAIVTKVDQPTGNLTYGTVRDLLTNTAVHPRGIKVRLETGEIGRVQTVYE